MNWSSIVKKNNNVINENTEKHEKSISPEIIKYVDIINDYTPSQIFDLWYNEDMIEILNEMENYVHLDSYPVFDSCKTSTYSDFINLIKDNINLEETPENLRWIKDEENSEEIEIEYDT